MGGLRRCPHAARRSAAFPSLHRLPSILNPHGIHASLMANALTSTTTSCSAAAAAASSSTRCCTLCTSAMLGGRSAFHHGPPPPRKERRAGRALFSLRAARRVRAGRCSARALWRAASGPARKAGAQGRRQRLGPQHAAPAALNDSSARFQPPGAHLGGVKRPIATVRLRALCGLAHCRPAPLLLMLRAAAAAAVAGVAGMAVAARILGSGFEEHLREHVRCGD